MGPVQGGCGGGGCEVGGEGLLLLGQRWFVDAVCITSRCTRVSKKSICLGVLQHLKDEAKSTEMSDDLKKNQASAFWFAVPPPCLQSNFFQWKPKPGEGVCEQG